MKDSNRNLLVRVLSAAFLVPILVIVVLWKDPEPMTIAVHLGVVIGLVEFFWITLRGDPVWMRIIGIALGLLISLIMYWCPWHGAFMAGMIGTTLIISLLHLIHFGDLSEAASRTGLMVFGIMYIAVLLTPLALLKRQPNGSDWIFLTCSITWLSDTGAYFTGRALGKHKLYQAISPGKSIEGAIGGLLASVASAIVAKLWYMPQIDWLDAVLIATIGGALGQAGDLVESMIKRGYQVKDSGWIIPGHGGLLDRIDALLFSTPLVYLYATYVVLPL